ncbi:D-lactaldehyde dehydrogenase [Coniophora puteana RWD-64-598 SS2]|uniref:D-lactaldehyde dehydrogenase n=1 Tax=Coniophora puteana (strain RWD-64-598) TaxID=741705 RepID=A0A5M3N3N8_CONPW|nr:D-lactaldehyde dehydrogenase [Coniophora puteana RWD-64-598 SS2]EIW85968.1 D-lactaldehyde dehydrogenase [Coniophora puteana RWD-64-598 SS2]
MPTVQPPAKILVTGANGFVAVWVVRTLLERGYTVRGTVRSADKGEHLKKLFSSYGDKLELVVVEDITKEGAFDEVVKGVDAIEHTASPFHFNAEDPEELIGPAVNGTVGILKSAVKNGSSVKRVVVTSSCAALLEERDEPTVFTEKDWNEKAVAEVKEKGREARNVAKYRASKVLAEKAAWEYYNQNKASVNWEMSVLNPPFVFGPAIHEVTVPSALNTSAQVWCNNIAHPTSSGATNEFLATVGQEWIDVRDLAEAHALALEKEAAGDERIIVSSSVYKWQDFIDAANKVSPPPKLSQKLAVGNPGAGSANPNTVHMISFDTSKAKSILGLKYRTIDETTRDTLADFEARGW